MIKEEFDKLFESGLTIKQISEKTGLKVWKIKYLLRKYDMKLIPDFRIITDECLVCGKVVEYKARFKKEKCHCSRKCANTRFHSDETKNKISNSLTKDSITKICLFCKIEFSTKRKYRKFCSSQCSHTHIKSDENYRSKISKKRTDYLMSNNHSKWFETKNVENKIIKVQGSWEYEFANSLNRLNILYDRKSVKVTNCNRYVPDFYLPDYNIFIEVKGFLYEKDKYKMLKAIDYSEIDLRIIFDFQKIKSLTKDDLLELKKVKNIINYETIDYSKFQKRY
jgi:endogenous inhibitor of DNA gyrase (YacG/DUF329 family)